MRSLCRNKHERVSTHFFPLYLGSPAIPLIGINQYHHMSSSAATRFVAEVGRSNVDVDLSATRDWSVNVIIIIIVTALFDLKHSNVKTQSASRQLLSNMSLGRGCWRDYIRVVSNIGSSTCCLDRSLCLENYISGAGRDNIREDVF